MGAEAVIALLLALLDRASAIGALLGKVQAEGRDITEDEITAIMHQDDSARDVLVDAIARRKAAPEVTP